MTTSIKTIAFASQASPRLIGLEEAVGRLGLPEATEASQSAAQQVTDYNEETSKLADTIERWSVPIAVELNANVEQLVKQSAARRAERVEWWRKCRFLAVMRTELAGLLMEDLAARIQQHEKALAAEQTAAEQALALMGHTRETGMMPNAHLDRGVAQRQLKYAIRNCPKVRDVQARIDNAKESRRDWAGVQSGSSELLAAIEASLADELRRLAEGN